MTNVTVLKMTTFIFKRAWQEKWKWKQRNLSPVLELKHKSSWFSTLSYTEVFMAKQNAICILTEKHKLTCMPCSAPWGSAQKKTQSCFFGSVLQSKQHKLKTDVLLGAADSLAAVVFVSFSHKLHVWMQRNQIHSSIKTRNGLVYVVTGHSLSRGRFVTKRK